MTKARKKTPKSKKKAVPKSPKAKKASGSGPKTGPSRPKIRPKGKKSPAKKAKIPKLKIRAKANPKTKRKSRLMLLKKPKKAAKKKKPAKKTDSKKPLPSKKKKPLEKPAAPRPRLNRKALALLSDAMTRNFLVEAAGENALGIIKSLSVELSDEDLSKKLKIKISDVRATLNKLHSIGVVQYNRYKDADTGWFSYFWSLNLEKMQGWVIEQLKKTELPADLGSSEYYFCSKCAPDTIYSFVDASDYGFRCPVCASQLEFIDEGIIRQFFPNRPRPPML